MAHKPDVRTFAQHGQETNVHNIFMLCLPPPVLSNTHTQFRYTVSRPSHAVDVVALQVAYWQAPDVTHVAASPPSSPIRPQSRPAATAATTSKLQPPPGMVQAAPPSLPHASQPPPNSRPLPSATQSCAQHSHPEAATHSSPPPSSSSPRWDRPPLIASTMQLVWELSERLGPHQESRGRVHPPTSLPRPPHHPQKYRRGRRRWLVWLRWHKQRLQRMEAATPLQPAVGPQSAVTPMHLAMGTRGVGSVATTLSPPSQPAKGAQGVGSEVTTQGTAPVPRHTWAQQLARVRLLSLMWVQSLSLSQKQELQPARGNGLNFGCKACTIDRFARYLGIFDVEHSPQLPQRLTRSWSAGCRSRVPDPGLATVRKVWRAVRVGLFLPPPPLHPAQQGPYTPRQAGTLLAALCRLRYRAPARHIVALAYIACAPLIGQPPPNLSAPPGAGVERLGQVAAPLMGQSPLDLTTPPGTRAGPLGARAGPPGAWAERLGQVAAAGGALARLSRLSRTHRTVLALTPQVRATFGFLSVSRSIWLI